MTFSTVGAGAEVLSVVVSALDDSAVASTELPASSTGSVSSANTGVASIGCTVIIAASPIDIARNTFLFTVLFFILVFLHIP